MDIRKGKLLLARSQLLTAIELHFEDKDPFSVHTLAGAAQEIIEVLCRKASVEPFTDHILQTFPDKTRREVRRIINLYKNTFKHADRDDDAVIAQFEEVANDFMIYVAVEDYLRLRDAGPVPMQVYQVWFCAVHEDRLSPSVDKERYRKKFPGIRSLPREKQKCLGREAIARNLANDELLANPRTEPLNLGS